METLKVDDLGAIGLVADKSPHTLPPNAWSAMQNARCVDRSVGSFAGHEQIDTITLHPQTINFCKTGASTYLVYAENSEIKAFTAGTETTIGTGFSTGGYWDSCVLGGVVILNNGVQNPQYWGGEGNTVDLPYDSTDPSAVCTWDSVGMKAKVIRPFRYHLIALDIDDCDGRNRRKVHWSHPAEPGSVPVTWAPEKPEYQAGFVELSETPGAIVDGLALRDTFQIYKEDAIYAATYTGVFDGQILNFRLVTTSYGLYARNCVCDVGGRHFFVGDGDIYIYDGTTFQSIADERVKNLFFNGVSRAFFYKSYAIYYHRTGEVWLCYPTANNQHCNKALVWDVNSNTWSPREIPTANAAVFAIVDRQSTYTWATLPYSTWADWGNNPPTPVWDTWGAPIDTSAIHDSLVLAGDGELFEMDQGNTADGTHMVCYVQREEIDLGDKVDYHMITRVMPVASGDPFQLRIGTQENVGGAITWSAYQTFDPSTDYALYFRETGRLGAWEVYSDADVSWILDSVEIDYVKVGRR